MLQLGVKEVATYSLHVLCCRLPVQESMSPSSFQYGEMWVERMIQASKKTIKYMGLKDPCGRLAQRLRDELNISRAWTSIQLVADCTGVLNLQVNENASPLESPELIRGMCGPPMLERTMRLKYWPLHVELVSAHKSTSFM